MTSTDTHPILYGLVDWRTNWNRVNSVYTAKIDLMDQVEADSQYPAAFAEACDPAHPNAETAWRSALRGAVDDLLSKEYGWHALSLGRRPRWFHEDFATAEDWAANCNMRISQREQDKAALDRALVSCERTCKKQGYVFDPQYDTYSGELVEVFVHRRS